MAAHILLLDPDAAVQAHLGHNLHQAGHTVTLCNTAGHAMAVLAAGLPDLLLLEWDLGTQSGVELIRTLRADTHTSALPIIMVSARDAEQDAVFALETGADDYVTKPLRPRALIARIHAVLRRRAPAAAPDTVQMAGLRLDPGTLKVTAGTQQLALGRVEFRLLQFLMHHPGRVHSRAQLLDQVWGRQVFLGERTVDTHVGRLRTALQPSGHQEHIQTVRGSGYCFVLTQAGANGAVARL